MPPTLSTSLLSHFCSLPLVFLFWTHHQNQDMGLWGCRGFLYNIIKNSHVSEYREKDEGKWGGGGVQRWGCNRKLKITYTQVQNSLQCHFGSWDVESCHYTWSSTSQAVHKSLRSGYNNPTPTTDIDTVHLVPEWSSKESNEPLTSGPSGSSSDWSGLSMFPTEKYEAAEPKTICIPTSAMLNALVFSCHRTTGSNHTYYPGFWLPPVWLQMCPHTQTWLIIT